MKKLMIAAAIVCAAAMSQAADFKWNLKTNGDPLYTTDGGKFTGTGYMLVGDVGETFINLMAAGSSFDDALAASTQAGTVSFSAGETSSQFQYGTEAGDYTFTLVADMGNAIFVADTYWDNASSNPEGKGTDIGAYLEWTADGETRLNYTQELSGGWNDQAGYYTQAVPEPTSGLLLLLGVAGLALRRRRA